MELLAIAYPELKEDDYQRIQDFRRENDRQYGIIEPHFTFVFPLAGISSETFIDEARRIMKDLNPFSITLPRATIHKDSLSDQFLIFLVPSRGEDEMRMLHDRLYSGKLSTFVLPGIEFIPHMTIGHFKDETSAQSKADEWNKEGLVITGEITSIDIVNYQAGKITALEKMNF